MGEVPQFKHTHARALRHFPQSKHHSEQSCALLLHLQSSRLKIGQWLISYWGQWIEDDLNGSSEAKCRLSGAAVSTKNSFIDRLSTSFSLNLLSLSAFPTPVLCDCWNHTFSEQQTEKQSEAHTHLHAQVLSCTSSSEQSAAMGSADCQTHCVSKRTRGVRTHWQLWDDWTVNSWLLSCYECLDVLLPHEQQCSKDGIFCQSVQCFGPEWNTGTFLGLITMKFWTLEDFTGRFGQLAGW